MPVMIFVWFRLALGTLWLGVQRRWVRLLYRHSPAEMVSLAQKLGLGVEAKAAFSQDHPGVVLFGSWMETELQRRQVGCITFTEELKQEGKKGSDKLLLPQPMSSMGIKFLFWAPQFDTYRVLILLSPHFFILEHPVPFCYSAICNTCTCRHNLWPLHSLYYSPCQKMAHLKPKLPFFIWNIVSACVCMIARTHSHTCISLFPLGPPDWVARVTYLTLCLVLLCWSSNYVDLGWRQSQDIVHRNILHGTICSTDFDVALKQILLPKWTLYWTPCTKRMALVWQ